MKHNFKTFAILTVFAGMLVSCSQNWGELSFPQSIQGEDEDYVKLLSASISDFQNEDITRTSIKNTAGNLQLLWGENDEIGIFPARGFQVAFPMTAGAGSKNATFDGGGWGLKSSTTYSAYYPLVKEFYLDKTAIPVTMTCQKQTGNNNSDHIAGYDYMVAINSTVNAEGGVSFDFRHQVSILHMQFKMPSAGSYTSLIMETSGSFTTEATLDLTDGGVTATKTSAIQTLSLKDVSISSTDEYLEVYMSILPTDLTGKVLCAKIYDSSGTCYTASLTGKKFVAGTIYNIGRSAKKDINTGLATVIINTPKNEAVVSKTDWMKKASIAIIKSDGSVDYDDNKLQIRGRGNSTWGYPKKPYALKLDSKSKILGMPKHKRWVLLANWMDRTLMRNDVSFQIAKRTGLAWTPRGEFVEVVLNGEHVGNYYLCEQIKIDKNRVNITEMTAEDVEGDAITGGYLMELDVLYDEVNKFYSATKNFPYMFKEPDEEVLQPAQLSWFENYINEVEGKLYSDDWLVNREYANYMDLASFVDWWFVYELAGNWEPNHPKSCYLTKDRLGKLTAGPVWDFDYGTYVPETISGFTIKDALYYGRLFSDPAFVTLVKERWTLLKPAFDGIPDYMRTVAAKIKASNEIDKGMWPASAQADGSVNGDQNMSFDEAIDRMVSAYSDKLTWLDGQIASM